MADVNQLTIQLEAQAGNSGDTPRDENTKDTSVDGEPITICLLEGNGVPPPTTEAPAGSGGSGGPHPKFLIRSSSGDTSRDTNIKDTDGAEDGEPVTICLLEGNGVPPPETAEASASNDGSMNTTQDGTVPMDTTESSQISVEGSITDTSIASGTSGTPTTKKRTPGKWSKYKKRYNAKWESEPGLMEWVRRVPGDDTKVLCRFCQNVHRAHRTELTRHAKSTKHKSQSAFVVLPQDTDYSSSMFLHMMPRMFKCMRVVRVTEWGGSEVLEVFSDVSMPQPEANQVLIKVGAIGVNPVDAYIRSGQYANLPSLPWTPGADCAGTVEAVGPLVNKFKIGDRVYTNGSLTGTYAEYTLCTEDSIFNLSEQLDFKGGAALGIPYFTAYRALIQRAKARAGQTVLIHGASGSVGMAAVQFARAYGMTVLGTAGSDEGIKLVREFGAHFVFNHREEDYVDEILTATEGDGVDVIIEMLANVNLQKDLELLSMGGTVAVVGNRGTVEINPRLLMPKESSVVGVMLPKATQKERRETATAIASGIEAGWIRPHIGMEFPLEGAPFAHEELLAGHGSQGRIILVP